MIPSASGTIHFFLQLLFPFLLPTTYPLTIQQTLSNLGTIIKIILETSKYALKIDKQIKNIFSDDMSQKTNVIRNISITYTTYYSVKNKNIKK